MTDRLPLLISIYIVSRSNFIVITIRVWKVILASIVALIGRSPSVTVRADEDTRYEIRYEH